MNYCYICSNKKCDLLVILQRLSKEDYPYTKGIPKVYDWQVRTRRKIAEH